MASSSMFRSPQLLCVALVCLVASLGVVGAKVLRGSREDFNFKAEKTYNGAHRGASGEFPESSIPGFKRAIENGATIIETDIGVTSDGKLICLHDTTLDAITDVAERAEFAHKKATYLDQGVNVTGFFAVDFTLEEIKSLRLKQRYSFRDHSYDGMFQIPTFEEYLTVALDSDRVVTIDPEIKNPVFINAHVQWPGGKLFEDEFVDTLLKYGYQGKYQSPEWLKQPVFIQTFSAASIYRIVNRTNSPKIFNIGAPSDIAQDTGRPYSECYTDAFFDHMSQYVAGLSTFKHQIVPLSNKSKLMPASDFVDRAHARGLLVQTATFTNDQAQVMALDFVADPEEEFNYFVKEIGADIILTDNPKTLAHYLKEQSKNKE